MKIFRTRLATLLTTAVMAACGGSSDDNAAVQPDFAVVITKDNAGLLVSDSLHGDRFESLLGRLPGQLILDQSLRANIFSALGNGAGALKSRGPEMQAVVLPNNEFCVEPDSGEPTSGWVTLSGEMAIPDDMDAYTAGDSLQLDFGHCGTAEGLVLDGSINFKIEEFNGSLANHLYAISMIVTLTDLTIDHGDIHGPATVNGEYWFNLDSTSYPLKSSWVLGKSVTVEVGAATKAFPEYGNLTFVDFNLYGEYDSSTGAFSEKVDGTMESHHCRGHFSYETVQAFEANATGNPYSGAMVVSGAAKSSIRVDVMDAGSVRVQIDYDGDGAVDETRELSWDEAMQ